MKDCIFCKIVAGEIPSDKVYEDTHVLAFKDIAPLAPKHILVIPKIHCVSVKDSKCTPEVFSHISQAVQKITSQEGIEEFRLVTNIGEQGGQTVFHLHFHILAGRQMRSMG